MIRALLVDDERPAREKLRTLLAREGDVEIVGEAANGDAAIREIRRLDPDVVFLDIRMPRRDGFEVIDAVGAERMPLVVFVTAHDEHALRAFEVHALDYLLKPFARTRLVDVLERVRERLVARDGSDLVNRLRRAFADIEAGRGTLSRILVESRPNHEVLLEIDRIDFVRSRKNYLEFHTPAGQFLRRGTLSALEEKLGAEHFARISRSEIVRLGAVKELQPWFHGDYHVILKSGETLTWSRR